MIVSRYFILPAATSSAPAGHLAKLLERLAIGHLSSLHGRTCADVAALVTAPASSIAVLEGLLGALGCGFIVEADWTSGGEPPLAPARPGTPTAATLPAASDPQPLTAADLARPLASLPFSVRAANCFAFAGLRSVGDLIQCCEADLLAVRNLGQTTVTEIKQVLGALGHGLGQSQVPAPSCWPISVESAGRLIDAGIDSVAKLVRLRERTLLESGLVSLEELLNLAAMVSDLTGEGFARPEREAQRLHVNLNLLVRLEDLGYPQRSLGRLNAGNRSGRLLDAWAIGRSALEERLGPGYLKSLERVLVTQGLSLHQDLDSRISSHAEDLANVFSSELASTRPRRAHHADDEIRSLSGLDGDDRNKTGALHCLGWDGGPGSTLEAAGQAVGLSRERIRQLRKAAQENLASNRAAAVLLEGALDFIADRVPAWAEQLESDLVECGVSRSLFRLEGLLLAARTCGFEPSFVLVEDGDLRIVVGVGNETLARTLLKATRRRSRGEGEVRARARCLLELKGEPVVATSLPPVEVAVDSGVVPPRPAQAMSDDVPVPTAPGGREIPEQAATEVIAGWLLETARERGFLSGVRPWSLAELNWNRRSGAGLRHWGQVGSLRPASELSTQFLLAGVRMSGGDAAALVFLALSTEVGRREGHEGELWPVVRKRLGPTLEAQVFHETGMLRRWVRDSLERVCPRLGLRHVFGQEGIHAWVRTAFLQFGVTDAGWERLPGWLSGQPTSLTVKDLLTADGPLFSRSFADVWGALAKARTSHRDPERLYRELRALMSPWLSGADLQRVAQCALARPELAPAAGREVTEAERSDGLFVERRLVWVPGTEPRFVLELRSDPPAGSEPGPWALQIHGHSHHAVSSQGPGRWQLQGEPVAVGLHDPSLHVEVRQQGRAIAEERVTLVDTDEEILLFNLVSGRELNAWAPLSSQRQGVAILARADLELVPRGAEWTAVCGGAWRLWRFNSGVPDGTVALLGGQEIWRCSHATASTRPYRGRAWCTDATRWGDISLLRVEVEGGEPLALRVGNASYPVEQCGSTYRVRVEIGPGIRPSASARAVVLVGGRRTTWPVHLQIDPPWAAAREAVDGSWVAVRAEDNLDAADLQMHSVRMEPPASWQAAPADLAVLEGDAFLTRPRGVLRGLGSSLHGLGAPLVLCRGPYNRLEETEAVLCEAVLDSGVLRAVTRTGDGRLRLRLRAATDLTAEHRIWLWGWSEGEPTLADGVGTECRGGELVVPEPAPGKTVACALEYRGAWLGAQYVAPGGPEVFKSVLAGTANWSTSARWLRWWRAPLLLRSLSDIAGQRVVAQPVDTLRVWLGPADGLPAPLRVRSDDPAWDAVVSKYFWRWVPSPSQALSLIRALDLLSGDLAGDLKAGWRNVDPMLAAHPVLLAASARVGIPAMYPSAPRIAHCWLLRSLRNRIARVDSADESAWSRARLELLSTAAALMRADRDFIHRGLLQEARALVNGTQHARENLRAAIQFGAVRDFIASSLVHEFAEAAR